MNTLLIEKKTGGYFKFTLNGDTANAITSINNDLLAVGNQLHFKTGNGANIVKEQFIYPADVTIVSGGTFTFTTVAQVWDKLIAIDYFAWLGGGGTGGVDRFDDLLDTFSYTGNAGKAVVVDNSELKLVPITLYNKRLFTELEDTPSSLVPDKMVVVNPAGTALIFQDQPEPPAEYLNSVGYFDYNDLATQTTPLNAVANVALKLTNDTEGANTSTDQNPYGVSYVWDYVANQFNFSELEVGDTIDVRVHVQITTTTSNQKVSLSAKFGIGSVAEFTNSIFETTFKSSGLHEISFVAPFYMGSTYITDYPAELYLTTDASATVKVDGWYVRILRKNINIITVDYQVEDATTTTKGIVRLAGDLSGTANNPIVPELANKVPTSRTIGTTSPLTGGGALSSNLALGINQANSIQSGYLSSTDWSHFESAYNDKINSATVTGTTTKTLTLNQQDGGTITASWTDINTDAVTSVFGRTGAVVAANGDYTTTQVTEGTNLYYTEARVDANTNVSANTAARHSAVTIGTANGLSISTQELSLGLASTSATGALSSTDWNTFNGKQAALSGTGFVKISGTTISYDNTTYLSGTVAIANGGTGATTAGAARTNLGATTVGANIFTIPNPNPVTKAYIRANADNTVEWLDGNAFRESIGAGTGNGTVTSVNGTGSYGGLTLTGTVTGSGDLTLGGTPTGSWPISITGNAASVNTVQVSTNADFYLTFADANNGSPTSEFLYTIGTVKVNPSTGALTAGSFVKSGGTSSQFLMADGSVSTGSGGTVTSVAAITLGTTGTDLSSTVANGTTTPVITLNVPTASATNRGALSAADWATFNSKFNLPSLTSGSVLFSNGTTIAQDNANLFWDNTNKRLGIGTTSPSTICHLYKASYPVLTIQSSSYQSSLGIDTSSGTLVLNNESNGALAFNTNATEHMRITSGGNVGIGTTTDAGYKLDVNGTGRFSGRLNVAGGNGNGFRVEPNGGAVTLPTGLSLSTGYGVGYIRNTNSSGGVVDLYFETLSTTFSSNVTATGFFNSSDNRLKDLIDYDYNVSEIKPITYLWKDGRDNKKHVGYSAQEVQKVMPDAVNEDEKGFLSVNYVEVLVAQVELLNNRMAEMEKEIAYLKSKI